MNWLRYLAEANLYLCIFYFAYCLFLKHDTFYQFKRVYLLFTCILSFLLPVVQIGAIKHRQEIMYARTLPYNVQQVIVRYPSQSTHPQPQGRVKATIASKPEITTKFDLNEALLCAYIIGVFFFLSMLGAKLYALFRLRLRSLSVDKKGYRLVILRQKNTAFSFFKYLFISADMVDRDMVIQHELTHINQNHSADIFFLELIKIFSWFNPIVFLLQNSMKTVHEYIADEHTAAVEVSVLSYSSFLVQNAYGISSPSVTNSFFNNNLLKKRILMLNKKRSGNLARLKYLVAIPICAALLCASTLAFSKTYGWFDLSATRKTSLNDRSRQANQLSNRKLIEVTQNGVTKLTDKITVNSGGRPVVYNAATITEADRSSLLKEDHIKVEVVTDSARFTTVDGRPILPVINVDGYFMLDRYLHNNINFKPGKGEKGGLVEVGFTLDNGRHITDARIVKSGGPKLDALALNGFKAYKGIVNDDAGKKLKLGVYFFTNDYSIFKTDSLSTDPEFGGELIITSYKYPAAVTSIGYEYYESAAFPTAAFARVVIFDKDGEPHTYLKGQCKPEDIVTLKDKYGYEFPSGTAVIVQKIQQQNADNKRLAYIYDVQSYLKDPYAGQFYDDMTDNLKYPEDEKKALKGGAVVLNFDLDKAGLISNVQVAKSAGANFDMAAVEALRSYKKTINDVPGKHSMTIVFCVTEKKYRPAVNDMSKIPGYVGELAVANAKPPFGRAKAGGIIVR